ncbi:MAG: YicC family protein [bacterium]|nr:YicC family protein [bacterium]
MTLLSMTGQGQGRRRLGSGEVTAEVRAVNNRHLKIQTRTSEGLSSLEPEIENLVRTHLRRGSLQINVQLTGSVAGAVFGLDESAIEAYIQKCREISERLGLSADPISITDLFPLPGVIKEPLPATSVAAETKAAALEAVEEALQCLNRMRHSEGMSMSRELTKQLERLVALTTVIEARAPQIVEEYRGKLEKRLSKAMAEVGAELREADLLREVLVMADRCDVREELVRLQSHFAQFEKLLESEESQGRKLDFLIQEMFREVNTIGSKAGDAEIAQRVVDIKATIEQMRELVQNLE